MKTRRPTKPQRSRHDSVASLNHYFRNGGNITEDREPTSEDCINVMNRYHNRPSSLAKALFDLGVRWDE